MPQTKMDIIPLSDYKISSSMHNGIELEVKIPINTEQINLMKCFVSATLAGSPQQHLIATRGQKGLYHG